MSGSNLPDLANFPNSVIYQRNANWMTHNISIDPFFVHYRQGRP